LERRKRRAMGGGPPERWNPSLPSPRAVEAAKEQAPMVGVEAPTAGRSVEDAVCAAEAPVSAAGASGSAAAATTGATTASVEPSRKRKRGFSTLR
jgi:hypothetical protein